MANRGHCVVARRGEKTAGPVVNFLNSCNHPNLLLPGGVWDAYNDKNKHSSCIAFQLVDGTLSELPKAELFDVVQQPGVNKTRLEGFSHKGLKVWSDLVNAVQHVNEKYGEDPPPYPLKLDRHSILYRSVPTGEYHVLIGDFDMNRDTYTKLKLSKDAGLEDIRRANWTGLGLYLENLVGEDIASPEILQLIVVLKSTSLTFDDIMWEPALWDAKTRMSFIRRVAACVDGESSEGKARRRQLMRIPVLGLQGCIVESALIDSVSFLRNKVAAHYDKTYSGYPGQKEDIGLERATIGRFLLKEKPDYMIKLIKQIRPLGRIPKSPIAPRTTATTSSQVPASS